MLTYQRFQYACVFKISQNAIEDGNITKIFGGDALGCFSFIIA